MINDIFIVMFIMFIIARILIVFYVDIKKFIDNEDDHIPTRLHTQPQYRVIPLCPTEQKYAHNTRPMTNDEKKDYLSSHKWALTRQMIFTRDMYKCTACDSSLKIECHHITYSDLGAEKIHQLTTLCRECHSRLHEKLGYDKNNIYDPKELYEKITYKSIVENIQNSL